MREHNVFTPTCASEGTTQGRHVAGPLRAIRTFGGARPSPRTRPYRSCKGLTTVASQGNVRNVPYLRCEARKRVSALNHLLYMVIYDSHCCLRYYQQRNKKCLCADHRHTDTHNKTGRTPSHTFGGTPSCWASVGPFVFGEIARKLSPDSI